MSDVLYIAEAAKRLGKTETALRALVQRGSANIPPALKVGGRWAFERRAFDRWLKRRKDDDAGNA